MKSASLTVLIFIAYLYNSTAQESKSEFKIEGQIAATTNGNAVFTNFGGPAMKFTFSKIAASISMIPSLKFENDTSKPLVLPTLGFGLQFYFLKNKR